MSRSSSLVLLSLLALTFASANQGDDEALWNEYGRVGTTTGSVGNLHYTATRMRDLTGALAAWEWQRTPAGKNCDQAPFCTREEGRITVFRNNYLVVFDNPSPSKAVVDQVLSGLPGQRDSDLPAIVTFLPDQGLVPDSARYVLGKTSLSQFGGDLASIDPGFAMGAEGQIAEYKLRGSANPVRLGLFYYPSPESARAHLDEFRKIAGTEVKRSGVLIAVVLPGATQKQADTILSRVEYNAKITWNDTPPPDQIRPLYRLLLQIIYMSIVLSAVCLLGGLIYAGMRIYRRRFGTLDADEAMTTLHLTGD